MLIETSLEISDKPLSEKAVEFLKAGRARFDSVNCFEFVPSDYELVWRYLAANPVERFCEWGSGHGIVTGLAEILGMQATGVEIDQGLVDSSRSLFAEFNLESEIIVGDYLDSEVQADIYFVYCWPGKFKVTEEKFEALAPPGARLLICYGQSQILCKIRKESATDPGV